MYLYLLFVVFSPVSHLKNVTWCLEVCKNHDIYPSAATGKVSFKSSRRVAETESKV